MHAQNNGVLKLHWPFPAFFVGVLLYQSLCKSAQMLLSCLQKSGMVAFLDDRPVAAALEAAKNGLIVELKQLDEDSEGAGQDPSNGGDGSLGLRGKVVLQLKYVVVD